MGIVHAPDSAFAREMVKWEARDGLMGTAGRPYVKREYPMMLHKASQLVAGGLAITDTRVVHTDGERAKLEPMGFRATPLEAIQALEAEQLQHAELAAERGYEKVHKLSPQARAEVEQIEDAAGAVHLPTIPETPILRRVPRFDAIDVDQTILENAEEQIRVQQTEIDRLRAQLVEAHALIPPPVPTVMTVTGPPRKRGRPKKVTQAEA